MALFSKRIATAALCYINSVGLIALNQSVIPGVIDNPSLINLGDMPTNPKQKEAHKRLLNYIAGRFQISPEELAVAKQAILDAYDPLPVEDH